MHSSSHILVIPALRGTLTLIKKLKMKIQMAQNKNICFCLKLFKRHHTSSKKFESINWLLVYKRVHQCINAITPKFVKNPCPYYLNEVYKLIKCKKIRTKNFFRTKNCLKILTSKVFCGPEVLKPKKSFMRKHVSFLF